MRRRAPLAIAVPLLGGALASCGGGKPPARPEPAKPAAPKPEPEADVSPPARPGRLWRSEVMAVLSRGLGDFLTRLVVEPVLVDGRFRGWRIVRFNPGDPIWNGTELKPGDVVVAVNARPIERPEQAFAVFQSLAIASELRVAYERGGTRRELVYPIDDQPAARTSSSP